MPECKKYIQCNIVEAEPMTRGEYDKAHGRPIPQSEDPAEAGYRVAYPYGYEVWVQKTQFEVSSRLIDGMTFGMAIEACRYRGAKIQRANWNGEGQFVRFEEVLASEDGKLHTDPQGAPGMVASSCFVFHFVNRKTGETGIQVGWLASQADMAADDWVIVE